MSTTADLLLTIVAATRRITEVRRERESRAAVEKRTAAMSPDGARFEAALGAAGRVNVIAECKRRSPSKGVLMQHYDPAAIAKQYELGGAVAISVLTEPTFFDGALEHLAAVRRSVTLPLLRKDFIVDEYQLFEARAAGADAVLLIVAAVEQADLVRLRVTAGDLGLATLVEVHDEHELTRAIDADARVIGVNNRNLRTLQVDVDASFRLAARIPRDVVAVSESGLKSRADLERLAAAGYRAFLIGERFMTDSDPARAIQDVRSQSRFSRTEGGVFLKVCGITRMGDALHAVEHGASALGFVFWTRSPRYVRPEVAAEIISGLPPSVTTVGVFVNESVEGIRAVAARTGISAVQLHGDEAPAFAEALGRPVLRSVDASEAEHACAEWPADTTFLVDAVDPVLRGGTAGMAVDWDRAAMLARGWRVVLAGGLNAGNVAEAISVVRPYGVDVSSGVEEAPGVKDPDKVARFLANARDAFDAR